MARASRLWIIQEPSRFGEIVAGFTVKHEMVTWLRNMIAAGSIGARSWIVLCVEDGSAWLHLERPTPENLGPAKDFPGVPDD